MAKRGRGMVTQGLFTVTAGQFMATRSRVMVKRGRGMVPRGQLTATAGRFMATRGRFTGDPDVQCASFTPNGAPLRLLSGSSQAPKAPDPPD